MTIFSNTSPGATFGTVPAPNPFWNGSFDSKRQVSDSLKLINHLEEIFVFCFFLASSFSKFLAFFTALDSISFISAGTYHKWDSPMKTPGARPSAVHLCFMAALVPHVPLFAKPLNTRLTMTEVNLPISLNLLPDLMYRVCRLGSCPLVLASNTMACQRNGNTQAVEGTFFFLHVAIGVPGFTFDCIGGTVLYYPSTNVYFPWDCILVYILLYKGTVFDETLYANILWSDFIDKNAYTYFVTFRTLCFEAQFYCPCSNAYFHCILLYITLVVYFDPLRCIQVPFWSRLCIHICFGKTTFKGTCINMYF